MAGAPVISSRLRGERLGSWKEIAAYLERDLRTVRRWEREKGLPVHRVPGGERRAVFAYRAEIDAWLSGQAPDCEIPSEDGGNPPQQTQDGPVQERTPGSDSTTITDPDPPPWAQRLSARLRIAVVVGAIVTLAAALAVLSVWLHRESRVSDAGRGDPSPAPSATIGELPPRIDSVSAILPERDQRIAIMGTGFGMHTPYKNASIPFIALRDTTAKWAAGRLIPQNWDEVTLNVENWTDTEIVISGFSGLYGSGE